MIKAWSVAVLTLKEGLRHRILYSVLIVTLLTMTASVLISGFFMRDISKILLDFCLATISIGGLLIPFFLAVNLLAGDIDRQTVVTILSRNISRTEYLVGKYLGISLLTAIVMLLLFAATICSVYGGMILYGETYFKSFSLTAISLSTVLGFLSISILNAFVVLWCTLTTTSFLATLLTFSTYLIGQMIDDVVRFVESPPPGAVISSSVHNAAQVIQYIFPNLAAFDHKLTASHGLLIPLDQFSILSLYAAVYIIATLTLSIFIFSRRDLC
ncbi:MAG: hypothetical protein BA863_12765 [Desulfovibrio sp. S3730MH75]|nr:MAG: hypothetical protein BA863_12765 [Desulfovibrio sp. S3730MH75]